jgi:hypothetical protein
VGVQLKSDRWIRDEVAHLPGVVDAVADEGRQGAARAEAILAAHRSSEPGSARIAIEHRDPDTWVHLIDEPDPAGNANKPNAVAIEFGRTGATGRGASQGIFALSSAFGGAFRRSR